MAENRAVFLDVDGVLALYGEGYQQTSNFKPEAMRLVSELCADHNAYIVMTSSRADSQGRESLQKELYEHGLKAEYGNPWRIEDTDVHTGRGASIMKWASDHKMKPHQCIIIDDRDISDQLSKGFEKRFIHVDSNIGFTQHDADKAKDLFMQGPPSVIDGIKSLLSGKGGDKGQAK
ncbi:MAG: HAD domain-containing protein [Rickettsiales bacterium]|nr:HAD domain-containing protein [Rickettsiales bacterium]